MKRNIAENDAETKLMFKEGILSFGVLVLGIVIISVLLRGSIEARSILIDSLLILIPVVVVKMKKVSFEEVFKLNKLNTRQITFVIIITLLSLPIASFFNTLVHAIVSIFINVSKSNTFIADKLSDYTLFFTIALSGAIWEELFFRGFLLTSFQEKFKRSSILITAILFAAIHFDISNFGGPLVFGLIFAYMVYLTNSIYAGIIGHVINNSLYVTLNYIFCESRVVQKSVCTTFGLFSELVDRSSLVVVSGIFLFLVLKRFSEESNVTASNFKKTLKNT